MPRPGDVVGVDGRASVQFTAGPPFRFRVIRAHTLGSTPYGWAWIDGYQLGADGNAVERREIFVDVSGLQPVSISTSRPAVPARRARNDRRPAVPKQRTPARTPARSTR